MVSKCSTFLVSAALIWVCPIFVVVMTMPLVLTEATEELKDVQMYDPLPPTAYNNNNIFRKIFFFNFPPIFILWASCGSYTGSPIH